MLKSPIPCYKPRLVGDGRVMTACVQTGYMTGSIYVSWDYGNLWVLKGSYSYPTYYPAISSDGKYQFVSGSKPIGGGVYSGNIYNSSDYGDTWILKDSGITDGIKLTRGIAISGDGSIRTVITNSGYIYVSSNYGDTWVQKSALKNWVGITMSNDGMIQAATVRASEDEHGYIPYTAQVYRSVNYGQSWSWRTIHEYYYHGNGGIAMSGDGKYWLAPDSGGSLWRSTDYGISWNQALGTSTWLGSSLSNDGRIQTATRQFNLVVSTDYGVTWIVKLSRPSGSILNVISGEGRIQLAIISSQLHVSMDYGDTWIPKDSVRSWSGIAISKNIT